MTAIRPFPVGIFIALSLALTSCDAPTPANPARTAEANLQSQKMAFLHQARETDPNFQAIQRAFINDDGELGVILDQSVQLDEIPTLTAELLTAMAADFPDDDLKVVVYTSSAPPLKLGTAHLDAASSEPTYAPDR